MTPPALVIFDCDGVIVDTEPPTNALIAERLAPYGPTLSGAEAQSRFQGGTMVNVADRARAAGYDLPESWVPETYEAMYDRLREGVALIPGIVAVFDALDAAEIPYCIGSNGPMPKMDITLGQHGLLDRFRGRIWSAHDVGLAHAKPSPGLFLTAAREMGHPAEMTTVIEDSATGAKAAKAAAMRCLGYAADTPRERLAAEGAETFQSMNEVPERLGLIA